MWCDDLKTIIICIFNIFWLMRNDNKKGLCRQGKPGMIFTDNDVQMGERSSREDLISFLYDIIKVE